MALTISATIESLGPGPLELAVEQGAGVLGAVLGAGEERVGGDVADEHELPLRGRREVAGAGRGGGVAALLSSLLVQAASGAEAASDALVQADAAQQATPGDPVEAKRVGGLLDHGIDLGHCNPPRTGGARSVGGELVDGGGLVPLARRAARSTGSSGGWASPGSAGSRGRTRRPARYIRPLVPTSVPSRKLPEVELDARLVGDDLQDPAARSARRPWPPARGRVAVPVEHPVVVVAAADDQLLEAVADARRRWRSSA